MYLSRADNFDRDRAESWKADADGILIYVCVLISFFCGKQKADHRRQAGLFSAVLATFVLEGLQELQPNSTDPPEYVDLLAQIYHQHDLA
jgi:hypothetical protein